MFKMLQQSRLKPLEILALQANTEIIDAETDIEDYPVDYISAEYAETFARIPPPRQPRKKPREKISYFRRIVRNYIQNRLVPYLEEKALKPNMQYSLQEAAAMLGIKPKSLRDKIRKDALENVNNNGNQTISGLNIAIYALKRTAQTQLTRQELSELFSIKNILPYKIGIKATKKGTYTMSHYVSPFYSKVAQKVRAMFERNPLLHIDVHAKKHPTKTFQQIVAENECIQWRIELREKHVLNPDAYCQDESGSDDFDSEEI